MIDIKNLTWKCHVCKKERPDAKISVRVHERGAEYGLAPDMVKDNVRYCNDNDICTEKSKTYHHSNLT